MYREKKEQTLQFLLSGGPWAGRTCQEGGAVSSSPLGEDPWEDVSRDLPGANLTRQVRALVWGRPVQVLVLLPTP